MLVVATSIAAETHLVGKPSSEAHRGRRGRKKKRGGEKTVATVPDMQDVWDRNTLIHGLVADMQKAGALVANGTLPARHLAHQTQILSANGRLLP